MTQREIPFEMGSYTIPCNVQDTGYKIDDCRPQTFSGSDKMGVVVFSVAQYYRNWSKINLLCPVHLLDVDIDS